MKSIFRDFKFFFPFIQRRTVNANSLMFRAFGATLFSFINYRYFKNFNIVDENTKKDFGLKPQVPSANF